MSPKLLDYVFGEGEDEDWGVPSHFSHSWRVYIRPDLVASRVVHTTFN